MPAVPPGISRGKMTRGQQPTEPIGAGDRGGPPGPSSLKRLGIPREGVPKPPRRGGHQAWPGAPYGDVRGPPGVGGMKARIWNKRLERCGRHLSYGLTDLFWTQGFGNQPDEVPLVWKGTWRAEKWVHFTNKKSDGVSSLSGKHFFQVPRLTKVPTGIVSANWHREPAVSDFSQSHAHPTANWHDLPLLADCQLAW